MKALTSLLSSRNAISLTSQLSKNIAMGYRMRVGRYRVLFDHDDFIKIIEIQEVKKRDERTY